MTPKNYFFLGIGGIGTSALASYFREQGFLVGGYDRVTSAITQDLTQQGVMIQYDWNVDQLPNFVHPADTQVVTTAAIGKEQPIYQYFFENGYAIEKRAVTLARIANAQKCIAVAGTHGKTSTLAVLTHIFATAEVSFTAFVGGVLCGYETNYLHKGNEYVLVEADEFDRSFLHLNPDYAAITSVDPDHLDIYQNQESFRAAFAAFVTQIKHPPILGPQVSLHGIRMNAEADTEIRYDSVRMEDNGYCVDFHAFGSEFKNLYIAVLGHHNLTNALMAASLATQVGIEASAIRKALGSFEGVQRRMHMQQLRDDLWLVDDYAHHPTEITVVYQSLKERFPTSKKTVLFQPHLYSRTQDFMEDFALALSLFDGVGLLPIYPARERPIPGVESKVLLEKIRHENKQLLSAAQVTDFVAEHGSGVIALLGAGDIGLLPAEIKKSIV